MSDVKLEGNAVVVEATDLILNSDSRRAGKNMNKPRRALVHGPGDVLVINWEKDYSGGVRIEGALGVDYMGVGSIEIDNLKLGDLKVESDLLHPYKIYIEQWENDVTRKDGFVINLKEVSKLGATIESVRADLNKLLDLHKKELDPKGPPLTEVKIWEIQLQIASVAERVGRIERSVESANAQIIENSNQLSNLKSMAAKYKLKKNSEGGGP